MVKASDLIKDIDDIVKKYTYSKQLEKENAELKAHLSWTKQCFKQALEVLGDGEEDSRVAYLESQYEKYFIE